MVNSPVDWLIADFVASQSLIHYFNKAITLLYMIKGQEIYLIGKTSINEMLLSRCYTRFRNC